MKVGDLIRHKDDRRDQFYVVIENSGYLVKIKHTERGWEHWLYTMTSETQQWEIVCESR